MIKLSIRLIPHGQIQPGFFIYHAFFMGKGFKAFFSVVGTHAAFSEAAEAHLAGGKMNDRIIDASASKAAVCRDFFSGAAVTGKDIQCQRVGQGVDSADGFI